VGLAPTAASVEVACGPPSYGCYLMAIQKRAPFDRLRANGKVPVDEGKAGRAAPPSTKFILSAIEGLRTGLGKLRPGYAAGATQAQRTVLAGAETCAPQSLPWRAMNFPLRHRPLARRS
jgi:hypothetical protein